MLSRLQGAARRLSIAFTGLFGYAAAAIIGLLAIIGNVGLAAELIGYPIALNAVLLPALAIVVANIIYRERAKRRQAESDLAELRARPDPAATTRAFLKLHDEGAVIATYFESDLERMREQVPIGKRLYRDWIARCSDLIELERPEYALPFRSAQVPPRTAPALLLVHDGQGYVSVAEAERWRALVNQATAVLAEIVSAGRAIA